MKKRKKIWLAAALFVIAESFAFPGILFSDCIRAREAETVKEKETQPEFEWKIWFLQ